MDVLRDSRGDPIPLPSGLPAAAPKFLGYNSDFSLSLSKRKKKYNGKSGEPASGTCLFVSCDEVSTSCERMNGVETEKQKIDKFFKGLGAPKAMEFAEKFTSLKQVLESSTRQLRDLGLPVKIRKALLKRRHDLRMNRQYLNTLRMWEIKRNPQRFQVESLVTAEPGELQYV